MTDTGRGSGPLDLPHASPVQDDALPGGDLVHAVCPYLVADGGGWRSASPTRDHRCTAIEPPVALALAKQRELCLRPSHRTCATYRAAGDLAASMGSPPREGDAGLWASTSGSLVALTPVRTGAPRLSLARARTVQGALVGVMALVFAVLVLARTTPPQPASGTSAAPGGESTPSGAPSPDPGSSAGVSVSPSVPPSASPASPPPSASASPAATPVPTPEPSAPSTSYTVKRGDTLSSIAAAYGTTVKALKKANGLTSTLIRVGQELVIP